MQINEKFKAVSDPTRRKILDLLRGGTMNAGEIAEACEMTKPNISQHLNTLKKSGLIQDAKQGLHVYYSLIQKDFQLTHREVMGLLNIKDKILLEVKQIAEEKKCESVTGATNSQDEGIVFIMKEAATILSFQYSFRLSSFEIVFENPSETLHIEYSDAEGIANFLNIVREIIHNYFFLLDKEIKEKNDEIKTMLMIKIYNNFNNVRLFGKTDERTFQTFKKCCIKELESQEISLNEQERDLLIEEAILEITSYGKLHHLMQDDDVTEITVVGTKYLSIVKRGKSENISSPFKTNDELDMFARRLAGHIGRRLDYLNPMMTGKFPDKTKITISLPVISSEVVIHLMKNNFRTMTWEDLISFDSLSEEMANFLQAAVVSNCNIIVSGGTGVGKTTALSALGNEIPKDERIVTIEDSHELQLHNENVIRLETRPPNADGAGQITTGGLLKFCRELSPNRIILGEVRDYAAYWSLDLMYGGVNFMTSIYSSSVQNAMSRFKHLVMSSGIDLSNRILLERICDSVDIVVHEERFVDGTRKITNISQVEKFDRGRGDIITSTLYTYKKEEELKEDGRIKGSFERTQVELSKKIMEKLQRFGYHISQFKKIDNNEQNRKEFLAHFSETLKYIEKEIDKGKLIKDIIFEMSQKNKNMPIWREITKQLETGVSVEHAFLSTCNYLDISEWRVFVKMIEMMWKNHRASFMLTKYRFDEVVSILERRMKIRNVMEKYDIKDNLNQNEWEFLDFLDLLSCAEFYNVDFVKSIQNVCDVLQNDITRKWEFFVVDCLAGQHVKHALQTLYKNIDNKSPQNILMKEFIMKILELEEIDNWSLIVKKEEKRIKEEYFLKESICSDCKKEMYLHYETSKGETFCESCYAKRKNNSLF